MSRFDIVRAWKDVEYRESLNVEELEQLPEHPAGIIELSDDNLKSIVGAQSDPQNTSGCCAFTFNLYCELCVLSITMLSCLSF